MDSYEARLDTARQRRPPGHAGRAWPSPRADDRRGGEDTRRGGGLAEREVAGLSAAASGANAAGVAGESVGGDPAGFAASVVAREEKKERGGGAGAEVGSKKRLPPASAQPPPPKRRAVPASARRQFPPGCGRQAAVPLGRPRSRDAGVRSCSGVLEKAAASAARLAGGKYGAACTSALEKVSAAGAEAPMADCGHHGPEAGVVRSSSEALRRSGVAAPDGSLGTGLQGVPAVLVEGRGSGEWSGELGRKEVVPAVPLQAEMMISFANSNFLPGCGNDAVLSVLVGGGVGEVRLPLESGLADGDLGVAEELVPAEGCISAVHGHDMDILPPQSNVTIDGTVQDDGLEEGEISSEVVVQDSRVSSSGTLQNSSASRHGASAEISVAETSTLQSSNEATGGNMLQCGEKWSSCLVTKEVEVMNIGSSCHGVAEDLAEDSSKQNLMCNRMSESVRMNRASSDVAAGDGTMIRSVTVHASGANAVGESVGGDPAGFAASVVAWEEERGGEAGAGVGSKKRLPLASMPPPPPKRRVVPTSARRQFPPGCGRHAAVALGRPRSGDAGVRGCSSVLEKAAESAAHLAGGKYGDACTSALEKVSAAGANAPMADCGHHGPEVGVVRSSSEALCRSDVAAPDGSLGTCLQGVPASGSGEWSGELGRKEVVPAVPLQAELMNRASSDVEAGDGTIIRSVTVHGSTAYRHGASARQFSAVETSVMQPCYHNTGGNTLQCEEDRPSRLVAKDVKLMNQSIGSSSNIFYESLVEDSSEQDMMGKIVSECARMNRTSSDFAAAEESGSGTKSRRKAMFTPRKVVRLTKNLHKEEETEHGRIKDTGELITDQVMQVPISKFHMTQEKEAARTKGFGPRKKVKVKAPAYLRMKIASTCALGSKGKLNDEVASNLDDDDILKALVVHEGKLELYLNNSSGLPSVSCQRQYGSENADARSKFKMLCRRFEFVCRALVQAVEQHSLNIRRIDLAADKVIRKLPDFTKHGPIVGQVPGVEVGDEFLYRVQLAIVGLHRAYQGGIDTATYTNGERIAISIVASGGYPDELPCSGELIYTGSGGKPSGKKDGEDQKLERGNLALKNCIKTKTPVRVIHGFKGHNTEGGSHSRAKQISTFTYDGLYQVVHFWRHGRPGSRVFKYKLQKIPGQAELPMHIAKGMRKSKTRPGLCVVDISQGKEGTPICVINTVDDVRPAPFRYITRIKCPFGLTKLRHQGCDCTNGCSDSVSCACAAKNGGEIPYNLNGAIVNEKPLIYECGPSCKCPPSCQNRVSQHGTKIPLEVFRTTKTGWGVRSLSSISSGSFICEYVGELLYGKEAEERRNSDYLFDIGLNCGDENLCNGLISTVSGLNSSSSCSQTMEDVGFTVDAAEYGNIGRFINHSCSPNLYTQNVLWDHDDKRMTHIMFFAAETIPPLQELTYAYNYEIDQIQDANGRMKIKVCQCGSPQCSGRLY